MVVGLTGGVGTGKSAALDAFGRLGADTVCLDGLVHEMSRKGGPLHRAIRAEFGAKILNAGGEIDRSALARAVFSRPSLRRRLERATHPVLLRRMRREIAGSRRAVVVVDAPLLFETGIKTEFDATMLVSAPRALALRRAQKRSGWSRGQVLARMRAQWPMARKKALADVVLDNRGSLAGLRRSVARYYRAFELIAASPKT